MRSIRRSTIAGLLTLAALGHTSCESSKPSQHSVDSISNKVASKPLVTLRNNSDIPILLGLRGPETRYISIPAHSNRSLNLSLGTYKYAATANDTEIISGYKHLDPNQEHIWDFQLN